MRGPWVVRVLGLVVLAGALPLAPAASQVAPTPDADPFYAPPPSIAELAPGDVIRSRPVTVNYGGLGVPLIDSWQILYRTTDTKGRPIATATTLMVPKLPYLLGVRPLVSYQMAIDSLGPQCRPSYTLAHGAQKELGAVVPLLQLGYAVTTSDFEGPDDAYGAGRLAGQATLDGIRASLRFPAAGLDPTTPIGLWGYSGGGQATAWAAELLATYAPELRVAGIAPGGVPASISALARAIDGSLFAGLLFGAAAGVYRAYPEMDLDDILNDRGRQVFAAVADQCVDDFAFAYPFTRIADLVTVRDPLRLPHIAAVLSDIDLGKAAPRVPTFMYHSLVDQLLPVAATDQLARSWCEAGTPLFYHRDIAGEHAAYAIAGAPLAVAFLQARFAGVPVPDNCALVLATVPPAPASPPPTPAVSSGPPTPATLGRTGQPTLPATGGTAEPLVALLVLAVGLLVRKLATS